MVEVTHSFNWAPDGNHVVTVEAGTIVDGHCAEVAMQLGAGRPQRKPEEIRQAVAAPTQTAVRGPRPRRA